MSTPANTNNAASSWGSAGDWSQIFSGAAEGTGSAMQGASAYAQNKKEAREAKRRTLANLINHAMRRNQGLFKTGQEYGGEMTDTQSQAMQQIARGFVEALQGSTKR